VAAQTIAVVGAGALAATVWNLITWWFGLPASSGHALIGGLVGAAIADGGLGAVNWGGFDGWHPAGVAGVLVALAISPLLGFAVGMVIARALKRLLLRASNRIRGGPITVGQWGMAAGLSLSHGANDAQKSMGVVAALLLAAGEIETLAVPLWTKVACGLTLTVGTALGGWRIVRTIGRRIIRLRPVDSFASQSASTSVILTASLAGAPVSTTQVVASSVVGVGAGRRRWRHVRWSVVRSIAMAWLITLPAAGVLGAGSFVAWEAVA
jgi:PiT family inorganic phosphate transporter